MIGATSLLHTPYLGAGLPAHRRRICTSIGRRPRSFDLCLRSATGRRRRARMTGFAFMAGCFKGRRREKIEEESVQGGVDVWDADTSGEHLVIMVNGIIGSWKVVYLIPTVEWKNFPLVCHRSKSIELESTDASTSGEKRSEHLVIMVHGIIGSAADWRYAAEQFVKNLPDKVIVHRSECNYSRLTFDGVDLMGERLAEEVMSLVRRRPGVQKISFVAHSLGGLVARYAIGKLYAPSPDGDVSIMSQTLLSKESTSYSTQSQCLEKHQEGKVAGLDPMNFITFATPHLGSRGHKQLPFLCGLPFLERRASQTAHLLVGRTGKHLFLTDDDDGKPPLLLRMVDDCHELKFISALRSFKRRVAYANANFDYVVGWRTSSIRRQHELPKYYRLMKDEKYPHIVYIEKPDPIKTYQVESSSVGGQAADLEEEMIRGLNQVPWERVDVSFIKSTQRYTAHNTIQVKTYWMNSDGRDVVLHMIDNFLI